MTEWSFSPTEKYQSQLRCYWMKWSRWRNWVTATIHKSMTYFGGSQQYGSKYLTFACLASYFTFHHFTGGIWIQINTVLLRILHASNFTSGICFGATSEKARIEEHLKPLPKKKEKRRGWFVRWSIGCMPHGSKIKWQYNIGYDGHNR